MNAALILWHRLVVVVSVQPQANLLFYACKMEAHSVFIYAIIVENFSFFFIYDHNIRDIYGVSVQ